MAKDWEKIWELIRETSGLALELKELVRSYITGIVLGTNIDVDRPKVLTKAIQCYQDLQGKLDELKIEWEK